MRDHRRDGGLAVGPRHTNIKRAVGDHTQHVTSFVKRVPMLAVPAQLAVISGDGRRIDYQPWILWRGGRIVFIVDGDTFGFQLSRQRGGGPVIAAYLLAVKSKISSECTHTYAAY